MKLHDMRDDAGPTQDDEAASYPAGLRLALDDGTLDKLGLTELDLGDSVTLEARARVVAYEEALDAADGTESCRVTLQITDLGVAPDDAVAKARRDDARLNELGGRF